MPESRTALLRAFHANLPAYIPPADKAVAAALVRTIFAQPDREAAGRQLAEMARMM